MAVFGLVHGAWHGAWCWDLLSAELRRRGHDAVAVDLPTGPGVGAAECAGQVISMLGGVTGDIVLVGHSLGGLTVPLVASQCPVDLMVFLCAMAPEPGRSMKELTAQGGIMAPEWDLLAKGQVAEGGGCSSWRPDVAVQAFYPDCDPALAEVYAARLRRQCWTAFDEVSPLRVWPDVLGAVVLATDDACISPDYQRRVARSRFGRDAVELAGGHSPMLSRPTELATALVRLLPHA